MSKKWYTETEEAEGGKRWKVWKEQCRKEVDFINGKSPGLGAKGVPIEISKRHPGNHSQYNTGTDDIATVYILNKDQGETGEGIGTDMIPEALDNNTEKEGRKIYTRNEPDGAFRKERVDEILKQVKIGKHLTEGQRLQVKALLKEFADCFALVVGEVRHVKGAIHKLNVPADAKLRKVVRQRALTPPQKEYLHAKIDELLKAGVIKACSPTDVKCIAPTVLAKKAHEGGGLPMEKLMEKLNKECEKVGIERMFPDAGIEEDTQGQAQDNKPQKWRICQNFKEVNKVTKIAPMPQGDIRAKQQALSGHKWYSFFDFASGFYAVEVAQESKPYTAFYIEGRGYFWYKKMPFGLTGAPSTFAEMTGNHLHELVADSTIQLFVDDGATATNTFEDMLKNVRRILERV